MDHVPPELLVRVLRASAERSPEPLYAGPFAQSEGMDRSELDRALDRLRLAGLVRLTEWVAGKGQGYVVTPEGATALANPQFPNLARMADSFQQPAPVPHDDSETMELRRTDTAWDRGEAVRATLLEVPPPVVTMSLLALNILVFVAGGVIATQRGIPIGDYVAFSPNNKALFLLHDEMGALSPIEALGYGQWWRLLTYCFVHLGALHILLNMYFLFSVGPRLESMWGRGGFLFLYLLSGIAGGVAVVLADSAAVGASGALCGLLTSMVFWIWLNRPYLGAQLSSMWLRNVFFNIILIALVSMMPRVSAAGHFGGGLAGLAIAFPMTYWRFGSPWQRRLGLIGMIAVALAVVGLYIGADVAHGDAYRARVVEAYREDARQVHNVIVKMLQQAPALAKDDDKEKVRREVNDARQKLQNAMSEPPHLAPYAGPELKAKINDIDNFMKVSAELFESIAASIERPAAENLEATRHLLDQTRRWNEARRKVFTFTAPQ